MPRSIDETRRAFLVRLARSTAFVPPALLTLDVGSALGQNRGRGRGQQGGISPVAGGGQANQVSGGGNDAATGGVTTGLGGAPPWAVPPPDGE